MPYLAGFEGVLQADGYAGFNGLYERGRIVDVRLYAELGRHTLDQLTLISGAGHDVLQGMLSDLQRWRELGS